VQAPGYEFNPVKGHRAAGFLADEDLVCVPDLPQALLNAASTYEVLLVPVPGCGDQPAERHKVSSVEAAGLEGACEVTACFHLARPSKLFTPPENATSRAEEFVTMLEEQDGDLWALAEEIRFGNPPFRGDPWEILEGVDPIVTVALAPCTTAYYYPTREALFPRWCCILHKCRC
jgi:hypothetical protein